MLFNGPTEKNSGLLKRGLICLCCYKIYIRPITVKAHCFNSLTHGHRRKLIKKKKKVKKICLEMLRLRIGDDRVFTYPFSCNNSITTLQTLYWINEITNYTLDLEPLRCVGLTRAQSLQGHWLNPAALTQVSWLNSKSKAPFPERTAMCFYTWFLFNCKVSEANRVSPQCQLSKWRLHQTYQYPRLWKQAWPQASNCANRFTGK